MLHPAWLYEDLGIIRLWLRCGRELKSVAVNEPQSYKLQQFRFSCTTETMSGWGFALLYKYLCGDVVFKQHQAFGFLPQL